MTKAISLAIALIVLLLVFPLGALVAQAPPAIPHAFFGAVTLDGQPAPVGAEVEAGGEGVLIDITGNPLQVSTAGRYGGAAIFDQKLVVQGNLPTGAAISFFVNGLPAECALPGGAWQSSWPFASGEVTELNLRAFSTEQPTAAPSPTATSIPATATAQPTATPPPTGTVAALTATAPPTATTQPTAQPGVVAAANTATPTEPATLTAIPATAEPLTTLPPPPTQEAVTPVETILAAPYPDTAASPTLAASVDATAAPSPVETVVASPTVAVDTTIAALIQVATPAPAQEATGRSGLWFILVFVGIAVAALVIVLMGGKRPPEDADGDTEV